MTWERSAVLVTLQIMKNIRERLESVLRGDIPVVMWTEADWAYLQSLIVAGLDAHSKAIVEAAEQECRILHGNPDAPKPRGVINMSGLREKA
jgi:hypothetical protein